jgi:hypothetical protein
MAEGDETACLSRPRFSGGGSGLPGPPSDTYGRKQIVERFCLNFCNFALPPFVNPDEISAVIIDFSNPKHIWTRRGSMRHNTALRLPVLAWRGIQICSFLSKLVLPKDPTRVLT